MGCEKVSKVGEEVSCSLGRQRPFKVEGHALVSSAYSHKVMKKFKSAGDQNRETERLQRLTCTIRAGRSRNNSLGFFVFVFMKSLLCFFKNAVY